LPGASIYEAIVNATIDVTVSLAIRAFVDGICILKVFIEACLLELPAPPDSTLIRIIIALSPAGRSISLQISITREYYAPRLLFLFVVIGVFPFSFGSPVGFVIGIAICIAVICIVPFVTGILPLIFIPVLVGVLRVRTVSDQVI
jgi:hypothetical protein